MTYNEYRKECRLSNVEPTKADFKAGDIPNCVRYQIELQQPKAKTMAATAGH